MAEDTAPRGQEPQHQIALLDQASRALAEVQDLGTALEIHDKAEAIRHYCAVRDRSDGAAVKAAEIKLRAARRVGELLPPKATKAEAGSRGGKAVRGPDCLPRQRAAEFRKLAAVPQEQFEAHVAGKVDKGEQPSQAQLLREQKETAKEERRAANRAKVEATATADRPLVSAARYATIVADPPWSPEAAGVVDVVGRSNPGYSTMGVQEIAQLAVDGNRVADLADDDAHLYLWVVNRTMRPGFDVLESWGFRFVTILTWCKPSIGLGNYFRNNTEHVLFGVRGSQRLKVRDEPTWFEARRGPGGHSSKPDEFYDLVDRCSPGPVLELFGRRPRAGWTIWGEGA